MTRAPFRDSSQSDYRLLRPEMERGKFILTLRTDKPEAELGIYQDEKQLRHETWLAHRELAETIHKKLEEILNKSSISMNDLGGIVAFRGPGSFTGLRIGLSVANALAYGLQVPLAATNGHDWINQGIKKLQSGSADKLALPLYDSAPHVTAPSK